MIYLTYNDPPSGIYYSQVTDVCNFMNKKFNIKIRLVALISLRNFSENKNKIKSQVPDAIVMRMFPKVKFWKMNTLILFLIFLFLNSKKIIARGPYACNLALNLKKSGLVKHVCFDSRGAYTAELNEYDVSGEKSLRKEIFRVEKRAVLQSNLRIAVSNPLVNYWEQKFNYNSSNHTVIPCTLNSKIFNSFPEEYFVNKKRKKWGFSSTDIVLVYSGSSAGWQSLHIADDFFSTQLRANPNVKILFLIRSVPNNLKSLQYDKSRVFIKSLSEEEVKDALLCCDYGIIIREKSETNSVASPVKFAEYLACGLKIIISKEIGDYSDFVAKHDCGILVEDFNNVCALEKKSYEQKQMLHALALKHFSKMTYLDDYKKITE